MQTVSLNNCINPLNCSFILTQSVNEHLCQKYTVSFNFYQVRSINHIVFNHKSQEAAMASKDIAVLVEQRQYLKRFYSFINYKGKCEIIDKMRLLTDYYATCDGLQFQYPMMIVTSTDDIFMKRHKRIKHIKNEEGSNSDSSNSIYPFSLVNDESFLNDLELSKLMLKNVDVSISEQKPLKMSYSFEEYNIFEDEQDQKMPIFQSTISELVRQESNEILFDYEQNQKQVNYLVMDFDDQDRQEILKSYTKLANKENIPSVNITSQTQKQPSIDILKALVKRPPLSSSVTFYPKNKKELGQSKEYINNSQTSKLFESGVKGDQQVNILKKSYQQLKIRHKYQKYFTEQIIRDQNQNKKRSIIERSTRGPLQLHQKIESLIRHSQKISDKCKQGAGIDNRYSINLLSKSKEPQVYLQAYMHRINANNANIPSDKPSKERKDVQFDCKSQQKYNHLKCNPQGGGIYQNKKEKRIER